MAAVKTRRPGADHKVVRQAVDLIAEAKRPIILAGNGAVRKRAARQLRRFAHKTGIGVVNTFMGKGAVPMSDPHCLFTMGLQSRDYINLALDDADLVISVGYDLVEYAPSFWNHDRSTRIVPHRLRARRDRQPLPRGARHPGRHRRRALADQRGPQPALRRRGPPAAVRHRGATEAARRHRRRPRDGEGRRELSDEAAEDPVGTCAGTSGRTTSCSPDVGRPTRCGSPRYYQCETANTCLISNGFCSMGFALPGAMGAKLAHPGRKVLAIAGDAGFLMNVQDLETLVRYRQNVVVMVWGRRRVRPHQVEAAEPLRRAAFRSCVSANPDFELAGEVVRGLGADPDRSGAAPGCAGRGVPPAGSGAACGAGGLRGEREADPAAGEPELQHLTVHRRPFRRRHIGGRTTNPGELKNRNRSVASNEWVR